MILDAQHITAFQNYSKPLAKLEKSINKAGFPVVFRAFVAPRNIKMVEIINKAQKHRKLLCIEWASPAQAVKEVAKAVGL